MAISSRDCSQSVVKKVPFSSKKRKTTPNQSEEESLRSRSAGHQNNKSSKSRCSIKKKSAAVFPQPLMVDVGNNNDEFCSDEAFHGEEGMWLSSDNTSISSFFEDQSTISDFLFLYDASVFSDEGTAFFNEVSTPLKTWNSILDTESTIEEDLVGQEEIVNWLLSSAEDDHYHTPYYSCCSASVSSDSTICDSIGSSVDVDRLSNWVSLMNLDGEQDSCYDLSSTGHDSDGTAATEPLFWPFGRECCDWSANPMEEAWDGFCMSPLNDTSKSRFAESRVVRSRVGARNLKEDFGSCRRRLVFSSESPAPSKQGSSKKCARRVSTNKSRKALKGESSTKVSDSKISSIEMIVGLCEFDGHEGVDLDFNKDDFTLL